MKSKRYASVDQKRCAACGECGFVCPKAAVSVKNGCFAAVDGEICVGCGKCAGVCPAGCISIIEREVPAS